MRSTRTCVISVTIQAVRATANDTQIKVNLTNGIYVTNAFLDLIRKGTEKKIVFVSSSSGDIEFTRITGLAAVVGYSIAKAGVNMVATKYAAELAPEGIKTLSVSPGWVATDAGESLDNVGCLDGYG